MKNTNIRRDDFCHCNKYQFRSTFNAWKKLFLQTTLDQTTNRDAGEGAGGNKRPSCHLNNLLSKCWSVEVPGGGGWRTCLLSSFCQDQFSNSFKFDEKMLGFE